MMTEPYKRVGRGGAGNFYCKDEVNEVNKSADVESQSNPKVLAKPLATSQPAPEFLHTGRGGAGNWIQPAELLSQGLTQVRSPSSTEAPTIKTASFSKPAYRGGRGGAGNYTDYAEEERLKKEEDERVRRETEARIEKDVERGLAKPPKAYGGRGGAWEMDRMD